MTGTNYELLAAIEQQIRDHRRAAQEHTEQAGQWAKLYDKLVAAGKASPVQELARPANATKLVLVSVGPNKINVIKAIRELTNLGLKEAKDLVEGSLPVLVSEGAYVASYTGNVLGVQLGHYGKYLGAWSDPASMDYREVLDGAGVTVTQWVRSPEVCERAVPALLAAGATLRWE